MDSDPRFETPKKKQKCKHDNDKKDKNDNSNDDVMDVNEQDSKPKGRRNDGKQSDGTGTNENSLIPKGLLLSYLADAFGDLYEEDGLMVMGKGLGWLSLLASFVRFYADVDDGHLAIVREQEQQAEEEKRRKRQQQQQPFNQSYSSPLKCDTPPQRPGAFSRQKTKPPLVLVLALKDTEHATLLSLLQTWGTPNEMLPTIITNESGQSKDRSEMYQRGGVFCVTSRILIVDLLTNTLNPKDVDGMLIAHAEKVTNESTEAFIIRIYTSQKRRSQCFIKGFTDRPEQLLSGFARVEKTLKALQVRQLYLYPRFHDSVRSDLEQSDFTPIVHELHQSLSPAMKEIQIAIATAVQTCMRELKQSAPFIDWTSTGAGTNGVDGEELSIENCVMENFDHAISKQLEKDYHRLKPQTKQLKYDLSALRTLFQTLIQYDCIYFWKTINNIKRNSAGARHPSMWLLTPVADILFKRAKSRIYEIVPGKAPTIAVPNPVKRLVPVLEENPKWRCLKNVLNEIRQQEKEKKTKEEEDDDVDNIPMTAATDTPPTILIMTKDERTVETLRSYLILGRDKTMTKRWLKYLQAYNDKTRSVDKVLSEESRLLLEEENRVWRHLFGNNKKMKNDGRRRGQENETNDDNYNDDSARGDNNNIITTTGTANATSSKRKVLNHVPNHLRKRRRIALERGRGTAFGGTQEDLERQAVLDEAIETTEYELNYHNENDDNDDNELQRLRQQQRQEEEEQRKELENYNDMLYETMFDVTLMRQQQQEEEEPIKIVIKSYYTLEGTDGSTMLQDLEPTYVILYDIDIAFVRTLEVYAALRGIRYTYNNNDDNSNNNENDHNDEIKEKMSEGKTDMQKKKTEDGKNKNNKKNNNNNNNDDNDDNDDTNSQRNNNNNKSNNNNKIHIYFLIFDGSSEQKIFTKLLQREQVAFEKLIQYKQVMPPPVIVQDIHATQEVQLSMSNGTSTSSSSSGPSTYMDGTLPLAFDTRRMKNNRGNEKRDVVVDVREFRSALPSILHQGGMRLAPVTLTVGDFILSSVHCIERKSINDLYSSFISGRLYTQVEAMSKHYKCPCLLIEFESEEKAFCLQNSNELGTDIRMESISSKMVLLCSNFTKLRILWSKSPHETLRLFKELKSNHDEVNVQKAVEIGRAESIESLLSQSNINGSGNNGNGNNDDDDDDDEDEDEINVAGRDMLLRLPGVNIHNARRIMKRCDTLEELSSLSRIELRNVAGPVAGQKLFTFFRQSIHATTK